MFSTFSFSYYWGSNCIGKQQILYASSFLLGVKVAFRAAWVFCFVEPVYFHRFLVRPCCHNVDRLIHKNQHSEEHNQ